MEVLEKSERVIEKRMDKLKEKALNYLKNPYNFILVCILLFAFFIRLYYFILTYNQSLWWDEAVYGSLARNFISHKWDGTQAINGELLIRPLLIPFLWSFLIRFGFPESGVRFILEFIPSFFSVLFVYLIGREVFDKKTALISAFIFSALWIHLFYTLRLLTDIPSLMFLFSSIFFFIKSYKSDFNYKLFLFSLILLSFSTLMRYPQGIAFGVYFFILVLGNIKEFRNPRIYFYAVLGVLPLLLFFLMNYLTYGNVFPALLGGSYINEGKPITSNPLAFNLLSFIPYYLKTIFFIFFLAGLLLVLLNIFLGYDLLRKNKKILNQLLMVLLFIAFYSFFIFYLRAGEDRYLFPVSISLSLFTGFAFSNFHEIIKKRTQIFAGILLILILFLGAYSQITFADDMINSRKTTFLQIREGFEWMKGNTPPEGVVTGSGIEPYAIYYAEKKILALPLNENESQKISEADYLIIHAFSPQQNYLDKYMQENQDKWGILNVFFFDKEQKQPAFVIYRNFAK